MGLNQLDFAIIAVYLAGDHPVRPALPQAAAIPARLLPRRPQHSLVGDRALHRRGRNQHAHHHQHSRPGLRHQPHLPAGCPRIRSRARDHQLRPAAALLSRRTLHRIRTDRAPLRAQPSLAHRGIISAHPRGSGRCPGLRGLDRRRHRAGDRRGFLHRDHHRAHADLHLRRRPGRRDLDRRGADRDLCWRHAGGAIHHPASRSRRLAGDSRRRSQRRQAARVRLQPEFLEALHLLGGTDRRGVPHHRQSRHRPAHRAAPAGGARSAAIHHRAVEQRSGDLLSVLLCSC